MPYRGRRIDQARKAIQSPMIDALNRALVVICVLVAAILVLHILPQIAGGHSLLKWLAMS